MILGGAFVTENPLMQAGRASGLCLDFAGALILVPMMRRLLTWVRSTWLGRVIPVDESVDFHRVVGHSLFFLGLFHAGMFIAAFAVGHTPSSAAGFFESERFLTGGALIVVFAIMWLFSLSFIRKSHRFELFATTHLLWIAWFVLAIAHAPSFALWTGVPLLGFLVEQVVRLSRRAPASPVVSSRPQRSGVTRLEIARPPGFDASAGDYVFLRVPAIAKHEWHPFTISSAPERQTLTFHVRSLGNWTAALRQRVEQRPDEPGLVAYVDGPYGSPSAHIFKSRFAVMIGAGIGVTPFASVLESIVLRAYGHGSRPSNLQKVHFFWLNRDQYSFEWFSALLTELEKIDLRGLLEIHLCMTGARSGATAMGLEIAREVMHAWGRSDLITGLRTHTHVGPPDWEAMLGQICVWHPDEEIDVFFCGPPGLARKLRPVCERLGMSFREERF
jgi:predicted ferric reductase